MAAEGDAQSRDVGILVVLERAQADAVGLGLERQDHAELVAARAERAGVTGGTHPSEALINGPITVVIQPITALTQLRRAQRRAAWR